MRIITAVLYITGLVELHGATPPTFEDLFAHQAFIKVDKLNRAFGPGVVGSSLVFLNNRYYTYTIVHNGACVPPPGTEGVGLWFSNDAVHFTPYTSNHGLVLQGTPGAWDALRANFTGTWYDEAAKLLTMSFEGTDSNLGNDPSGNPCNVRGSTISAIGVATSTDGVNFKKNPDPILKAQYKWQSFGIGTPSINKIGSVWHLYFHAFDGKIVQVGHAQGPTLSNLTMDPQPVLTGTKGSWDVGTVGRRNISCVGTKCYMAFEGSTEQPYETAKWSSGLAVTLDMKNFKEYDQNPILPQTASGFGYDVTTSLTDQAGIQWIYARGYNPGGEYGNIRVRVADEKSGGFDKSWLEKDLQHQTGSPNSQGWVAQKGRDKVGYMSYGPYYAGLSEGEHVAVFSLAAASTSTSTSALLRLDVNDAAEQKSLAVRDIRLNQFLTPNRFEYFCIPFRLDKMHLGRPLEFRVYWFGNGTVTSRLVGIS